MNAEVDELDKLVALNNSSHNRALYQQTEPNAALLEAFPSPFGQLKGNLLIEVPEFTSLCPITGQPDFAKILIEYQPDKLCIESKSLKLYMGSYRNYGCFHEAIIARVCRDLVAKLNPCSISIQGRFTPRGGISFWPNVHWYQGDEV
ncbi:MAG: preQ(1) synthase [Bryobacteraceae bacterium]